MVAGCLAEPGPPPGIVEQVDWYLAKLAAQRLLEKGPRGCRRAWPANRGRICRL